MSLRVIVFLILNFAALGIGGMFTGSGVSSDWYAELNKAPWTPPGWVFGAAWTFIMVCFAFFMSYCWEAASHKKTIAGLYVVQWLLNVAWNPLFFSAHNILISLVVIGLLTLVITYCLIGIKLEPRLKHLLVVPYFIWLLIATSLNAYIYVYN